MFVGRADVTRVRWENSFAVLRRVLSSQRRGEEKGANDETARPFPRVFFLRS